MRDIRRQGQPGMDPGPLTVQPFSDLGRLLSEAGERAQSESGGSIQNGAQSEGKEPDPSSTEPTPVCRERELFLKAMADVVPFDSDQISKTSSPCPKKSAYVGEDDLVLAFKELKAIIEGKRPLPVNHTPEYVQGPWAGSNPELADRLHSGAFAVQAYCELHGMDSISALEACEDFFARAIVEDKRCLALIHGRGLSSPRGPVLKKAVLRWLAWGPFKRFILSFSSAPIWDGGAGVTYVLLRRHPAKRRPGKIRKRAW